jgi:hypothetical protein
MLIELLCKTPPDCGLAVESKVPVLEGKVSVAVTESVGTTVVAPLVAPFKTIVPIFILSRITYLLDDGTVNVTPLAMVIGPVDIPFLPEVTV